MRLGHFVLSAAAVGMTVTAGRAATVNLALNPVFEQEAILSTDGTFVSGGTYATRISWGNFGESRGVYEYYLPALAAGSTVSAASLSYTVYETNSTTSNASQLRFHSYAGNGIFSEADANSTVFSEGTSSKFYVGGDQSRSLSTSRLATIRSTSNYYGVMAWQEQFNYMTGVARSTSGTPPRLNLSVNAPAVGTVVTGAMFDVLGANEGGWYMSEGAPTINAQRYALAGIDKRAVMEFHLGGVPDGATITSATITFRVAFTTGSAGDGPNPILYGYTGNGKADLSDAAQTGLQLAVSPDVGAPGTSHTIQLDAIDVQSLLAGGDVLGIVVQGSADGNQFGIYTAESGETPVSLSVTYAVPEPGLASACAGALLLLARRRRPRR